MTEPQVVERELGGSSLELGVVIVSYNTSDLLTACLSALASSLEHDLANSRIETIGHRESARLTDQGGLSASDFLKYAEVWVVDNASQDASADMVRKDFPWVQLIGLETNIGFTAANNLILHQWLNSPTGPPRVVLLLNPDTEVSPDAIRTLRATLEDSPDIGMVGPSLEYPDGKFQHAAFRFPGLIQTALDLWPIGRLLDHPINGRYDRSYYARGRPFDVEVVLGACMMLSSEALRAAGPLDEGFFMYCEEIDWCRKLIDRGWRIVCVPQAVVTHHGGASTSQFRATSFIHLWRSRRRLMRLHAPFWKRVAFDGIVAAGLGTRTLIAWVAVLSGTMTADELSRRITAYRAIWAREAE